MKVLCLELNTLWKLRFRQSWYELFKVERKEVTPDLLVWFPACYHWIMELAQGKNARLLWNDLKSSNFFPGQITAHHNSKIFRLIILVYIKYFLKSETEWVVFIHCTIRGYSDVWEQALVAPKQVVFIRTFCFKTTFCWPYGWS